MLPNFRIQPPALRAAADTAVRHQAAVREGGTTGGEYAHTPRRWAGGCVYALDLPSPTPIITASTANGGQDAKEGRP
jgi:hypothetical protein